MTVRQIVKLPEPILRRKAKPVTRFDKNLQTLIDDMIETMRAAPGVGLAAPQVNIPERIIVIEYAEEDEEGDLQEAKTPTQKPKQLFVMANPEIVKASEEMVVGVEGCLSIPGLLGEVERHQALQIKGLNRYGKPMKLKVDSWLARIFQHEIDHVNGILFTDRATRIWQPEAEEAEDRV